MERQFKHYIMPFDYYYKSLNIELTCQHIKDVNSQQNTSE